MPAKRAYHSPLRTEQAAATRQRIVDAARGLLLERGFAATKLDQIAGKAGVALPTLTGYFPNKAVLLEEVLRSVARGASERPPLGEQLKALLELDDPEELLRGAAAVCRAANERAFELFEILRKAAAVEPKIEQRRQAGAEDRRTDQAPIARHLRRHRALRPNLSQQEATDLLWLYSSSDIYRLLVHDSGWSPERYEKWLGQALVDSLLYEVPAVAS